MIIRTDFHCRVFVGRIHARKSLQPSKLLYKLFWVSKKKTKLNYRQNLALCIHSCVTRVYVRTKNTTVEIRNKRETIFLLVIQFVVG